MRVQRLFQPRGAGFRVFHPCMHYAGRFRAFSSVIHNIHRFIHRKGPKNADFWRMRRVAVDYSLGCRRFIHRTIVCFRGFTRPDGRFPTRPRGHIRFIPRSGEFGASAHKKYPSRRPSAQIIWTDSENKPAGISTGHGSILDGWRFFTGSGRPAGRTDRR